MKTWLFCLGMILIAQPLAAQTPAAPTNVVLNLTPTDSLGLFLPGYDVDAELEFDLVDSLGVSKILIQVGLFQGDSSVLNVEIPFRLEDNFYHQGLSVVRQGNHIWIQFPPIDKSQVFHLTLWHEDNAGLLSTPVFDSFQIQN